MPLRQWNAICTKEIEAIAVDSELGCVYYSDENYGIRKLHANPLQNSLLASVPLPTVESDGSGITADAVLGFEGGIFVAMSTDRAFHLCAVSDLLRRAEE